MENIDSYKYDPRVADDNKAKGVITLFHVLNAWDWSEEDMMYWVYLYERKMIENIAGISIYDDYSIKDDKIYLPIVKCVIKNMFALTQGTYSRYVLIGSMEENLGYLSRNDYNLIIDIFRDENKPEFTSLPEYLIAKKEGRNRIKLSDIVRNVFDDKSDDFVNDIIEEINYAAFFRNFCTGLTEVPKESLYD